MQCELRRLLTEMGSEPFEPEEADEVINEIPFGENMCVTQAGMHNYTIR